MPITVDFAPSSRTFVIEVTGNLTFDEATSAMRQVYGHPEFRAPTRVLWDLRAATVDFSSAEVGALVHLAAQNRPDERGRVAVVVSEDVAFGLARMYGSFAHEQPLDLEVFRDRAEAEAWLAREP